MDEFGWHVFCVRYRSRKVGHDCRESIAAVRSGRSHVKAEDNYFEGVANARLIAAAPELLAACKAFNAAYECEDSDEYSGLINLANKLMVAAIAKAEGSALRDHQGQ